MTSGARAALIVAALVVSGGAYFFLAPACACLTPDQLAHARTRSDISSVAGAQKEYRAAHGRYAASLDSLGVTPHTDIELKDATDTSFSVEGRLLGVTCTASFGAKVPDIVTSTCTGNASR